MPLFFYYCFEISVKKATWGFLPGVMNFGESIEIIEFFFDVQLVRLLK